VAADLGTSKERLLLIPADLTQEQQVEALVEEIAGRWDGVDILVNLAGGWRGGKVVTEMSEEEWERVLDINLRTAFLINRAVLPYMVQRGWGRIVNVASKAVDDPLRRQAGYNIAKAGVLALTRSIAAEYRRRGVAANAILPSIIDTPQNRQRMPDADFSRWVRPEALAQAMLFLCSEEGGSINGAAIRIYGKL